MDLNQSHLDAANAVPSLYRPEFEHDACGVGFVASTRGECSNRVLRLGLNSICNLNHRGAIDADTKTGDGAGLLTQIPYQILREEVARLGHEVEEDGDLGVGFVFLPHDNAYAQARCKTIVEDVLEERNLFLYGWREVPINIRLLGEKAQSTMPRIEQALIGRGPGISDDEYERLLFLARNQIEKRVGQEEIKHFYITSFSHRSIVYKGLLISPSLEKFYRDLERPDYETGLCLFHQRYSTNTFPTWSLSQPFRMLAHNGEINTLRGNRFWMHAREAELQADFWGRDIGLLRPIIQPGGSDSASLDNAVEALVMSGRDILHAMTMLVPPAWDEETISPELRAFYEYHRCINEPWDGPAALIFSDGIKVGACLDRNGLRPARYKLTNDGIFCLASEVGVIDLDDADVIEKGRLAPGEMIAIDTGTNRLLRDSEIKESLAARQPYASWVREHLLDLSHLAGGHSCASAATSDPSDALRGKQIAFGYTSEELELVLRPMFEKGTEGIGSMGDDTPLAVLSLRPRLLYTYFKQLFAQVTNPPIDPIREKLVMSLHTIMGWRRNLLSETPEHGQQILTESPILFPHEFAALQDLHSLGHAARTVRCLWPAAEGEAGLERAIRRICYEAEAAVNDKTRLLVLSDRGVDETQVPVPALLAAAAVHHHLTRVGKRMKASIICETGEARDVHQVACLIGYGASAIYPYLAFATGCALRSGNGSGTAEDDLYLTKYRNALDAGLLKIMSKMGISVLGSYRGAQTFEAIGIGDRLIDLCFTGTPSQIGGIGFREIAQESLTRHARAFGFRAEGEVVPPLESPGDYRFRSTKGEQTERHTVTPRVIQSFHRFIRTAQHENYAEYVQASLETRPHSLRNLLEFVPLGGGALPLEAVEPVEDIRRRFTTAGMSLGALSPEAHECLAIAMNRIGGKSNSGEGGEDPARFHRRENGDLANSAIKQIAAGRFGVTAAYLASATEIEIKIAQGAKPGEGGQLPGHKVSVLIARLRKSTPGITLISPPPHHDIYSIEDLAQLIYDLKQVNPRARICVKLVAEAGVGTIAAGVAKARADIILISGHDGGTGASPLSSIKNAGSPWELGVAEAHQVLMLNRLRNRVTLRADGGMKTGEDVIFAALLGAEEYNFGTTALIAAGCVYVRQCHLNTCPVGVATQDERLRAKFKGKPENIVTYFNAVAQEMREIMARLGVRNVDQLVGRVEMLRQKRLDGHAKANAVDLSRLLAQVAKADDSAPRYHTRERNAVPNDRPLDDTILQEARDAITKQIPISLTYAVASTNRSIGTKVSGEIGYQHGEKGLPPGTLKLHLEGTAGQSLGAFLSPGMHITLVGEANDYVGKGMSGGEIVVRPPAVCGFDPHDNIIVGNTVLYGATGGHFFACGRAGERFGVRNSGCVAVIEGVGDHACEYMTNGLVVVLGKTGRNFAAGMTGGLAFVYDQAEDFEHQANRDTTSLLRGMEEAQAGELRDLIERHFEKTGSAFAADLLANWESRLGNFWKVVPHPVASGPEPVVPAESDAALVATPPAEMSA
jgi:glutamate synthase domain-containing protein 2/glutamate synthase domain-containing protein 1/glutamate synthase domain-containing protein 3